MTAVCALSGLSFLQAEETAQAVAPQASAPQSAVSQTAAPQSSAPQASPAEQVASSTHPFLSRELYPAWSQMTAERGLVDARLALAQARERMKNIRAVTPDKATFENVFAAYERMTEELDRVEGYLSHLSCVMDNPALRKVQEMLIPETSAFSSEIIADETLWQVIKSAAAQPWV